MTNDIKEASAGTRTAELKFRWKYILLPLAFLLLSVVLLAVFYPQLDTEVACRFNTDGTPKSWLGRGTIVPLALLPQILFAISAFGIAWIISRLGRSLDQMSSAFKPQHIIILMSNMVLLPQIILNFIMLDIFNYNINSSHLMPVWLFAVIVMLVGGVILTLFFVRTFLRSRNAA